MDKPVNYQLNFLTKFPIKKENGDNRFSINKHSCKRLSQLLQSVMHLNHEEASWESNSLRQPVSPEGGGKERKWKKSALTQAAVTVHRNLKEQ